MEATQVCDDSDNDNNLRPTPPLTPPPPKTLPESVEPAVIQPRIAQVGQAIAPTSWMAPTTKSSGSGGSGKASSKSSKSKGKGMSKMGGGGKGKWDNKGQIPLAGCSERWTKSTNEHGEEVWSRVAVGRGAEWGSSNIAAGLWKNP